MLVCARVITLHFALSTSAERPEEVEPVEADEEEGTVFSRAESLESLGIVLPKRYYSEEEEGRKEEEEEEKEEELHHRPHRPIAHARVLEELG